MFIGKQDYYQKILVSVETNLELIFQHVPSIKHYKDMSSSIKKEGREEGRKEGKEKTERNKERETGIERSEL